MTDSMGPGKLVRPMQNLSYTYDEYLICIGLGPSISSIVCKNPSYSGPSYPSSPVQCHEYYVKVKNSIILSKLTFLLFPFEIIWVALGVIFEGLGVQMTRRHPAD